MNKNLNKIAEELFNKIRSEFSNITLGNSESEIIDEPSEARYFEFDFNYKNHSLGSITVSIDEDDGLVLMFSNDIIENQPTGIKNRWFNFLRSMREFAKRRLMNFEARDILKSLDHKDYGFLSKNRKEKHMNESKLWGTNKTSYQDIDEARIIVKHSRPVNGEIPQGRAHGIDSIFIENSQGERFKYPFKHLNGARAMARHVANNGNPYDSIGEYITGLSEELSKLRMFKNYVGRNPVVSEAMDSVQTKVSDRINEIKKHIGQLHSQNFYEQFSQSYSENEYQDIPEEIMNDWIDKLTIRVFNEDLTSAFPFIYKLMNNTKIETLNPEDFATEEETLEESNGLDIVVKTLNEYEDYIDSLVEDDMLSDPNNQDDTVEQLNSILAEPIPVGADGTNAIESLNGIIDDQELFDVLKELADVSPETDARHMIVDYVKIRDEENGTDFASKLVIGDETAEPEETPAPEPTEPQPEQPAPAPAPAQPNMQMQSIKRLANVIEKAKIAGAQLTDKIQIKGGHLTLKDAIIMSGLSVEDFFEPEQSQDDSEQKIVEFVKSMYDAHEGTFPKGETGVLLSVEKQFGKPATKVAANTIKELRYVHESEKIKKLAGL